MMSTMLKHEWLRTRTLIGTIAALAALVTAVGALLTVTGWPVVSTFGLIVGVGAIVLLVPGLQIALAIDYWQSSYRRTGYFTQSLPIAGPKIYAAKMVWTMLVTLAAIVATLLLAALLSAAYALPAGLEVNPFIVVGNFLTEAGNLMSPWLLVAVIATVVVTYLIWPLQYAFAASVGSETPLNRYGAGGPVLVYVGLYLVSQLVIMLGMLVLPFGIGAVGDGVGLVSFNLVGEMLSGSETSDVMPLGFIPALLLVTVVCLWRTVRSWNRKVTLV